MLYRKPTSSCVPTGWETRGQAPAAYPRHKGRSHKKLRLRDIKQLVQVHMGQLDIRPNPVSLRSQPDSGCLSSHSHPAEAQLKMTMASCFLSRDEAKDVTEGTVPGPLLLTSPKSVWGPPCLPDEL